MRYIKYLVFFVVLLILVGILSLLVYSFYSSSRYQFSPVQDDDKTGFGREETSDLVNKEGNQEREDEGDKDRELKDKNENNLINREGNLINTSLANSSASLGTIGERGCNLVRPGNIQDVDCFVNYISQSEVSLKISNKKSTQIIVRVSITNCSPSIKEETLSSGEDKDFVFSCSNLNKEDFEEDVSVAYILSNETIQVFGTITGNVIIE